MEGKQGDYSAARNFLSKLRAITGSMRNTEQASTLARKKMFQMIAALRLPCFLFTITPEDSINFWIKIIAAENKRDLKLAQRIPSIHDNERVLGDFVI